MKKVRSFLCLLVVGVMLMGLTACSPFDGNFKEASAEEIKTVNAEVLSAMNDGGLGAVYKEDGAGMTSSSKIETVTKIKGKENKMVVESSSEMKNVDKKLQSAGKIKMEVNGDKLNIESYMNNDGIFVAVGDSKLKMSDSGLGSSSIGSIIGSIDNFEEYLEPLEEILELDPEELAEFGVKVYLDKSDKQTKIKFTLGKDFMEENYPDGYEISLKEYYITVILDADKKLYGIKAVADMSVKSGDDTMSFKVSGEMIKSDKDVKFPSFEGYEDANAENSAAMVKTLTEYMKKVSGQGEAE